MCLWSYKWSNLIRDKAKQDHYITQYEHEDGNLSVVRAIVQDADGCIWQFHNAKYNEFYLPWWKVEKWETLEQALHRELAEELGIEVVSSQFLCVYNYISTGVKRRAHYFLITSYRWIPTNHDAHLMLHYRAKIIDSDNELGFAVKVNGTITDDVQDIMHSFIGLYHRRILSSCGDNNIALCTMYREYDVSQIDPSKHYYLYLDEEKGEYYFDV